MNPTLFRLCTVLVLIAFYTSATLAQQPSDTTIHTSISLDEVVISANQVPEAKKTVSQQIRLIDRREISKLQVQTAADMVAASGSANIQKSQAGGGSPVIRGFEASRILLVIDGVRLNNLIYRGGHLQNIITLDQAIMERVEILFGPSSTLYGSDALGGVIHLFTRSPALPDSGRILKVRGTTRYGSVNHEKTGHVDMELSGPKFGSLSSITFSDFEDLRGGSVKNPFYDRSYGDRPFFVDQVNGMDTLLANSDRYAQIQSGYSQLDLLQKIRFRPHRQVTHQLNLQFSTTSDVPRYDRLTNPGPEGLRFAEWYYGPQRRILAAYDLNRSDTSGRRPDLHVGLNVQQIEESRHTRNFDSEDLTHRTENVLAIGGVLNAQKIIAIHKIRAGVDLRHDILESTAALENIRTGSLSPLDTRYPDGDNTMTSAAAYISHTWQISHTVTLNDGIRAGYSWLRSSFTDFTFYNFPFTEARQDNFVYSGSLGLIHSPNEKIKGSLLFSTGFRVPNVDDLAKVFDSSPGQVIVPNPDLEPELTYNMETGFEALIIDKLKWEGNAYYTRLKNAIVTDLFTFNGMDSILYDGLQSRVLANQNKRSAYIYGFSSAVRAELSAALSMTWRAHYTYGRIKTDSTPVPMDHIAPFSMHYNAEFEKGSFTARFFLNYNGWKRIEDFNPGGEDNQQYAQPEGMPAWMTFNLHAGYRFNPRISVRAGMDNILDTQYRLFASGINSPGRNVFLSIQFEN